MEQLLSIQMENNKQHTQKRKNSWKTKKKKKKSMGLIFPLHSQRSLRRGKTTHAGSEVGCSESIQWINTPGKRGEGSQTDNQRARERERERVSERDTQDPGETDVLGEQLVLFKSTITLLSHTLSQERLTQQLYPVGLAL